MSDTCGNTKVEDIVFSDSAHALFVRSIYLVCHRLISSWKSDVNVSLAGLELLSGLARLTIAEQGESFDYILCSFYSSLFCIRFDTPILIPIKLDIVGHPHF